MSYYANAAERGKPIARLRELADFLANNLQVPTQRYTDMLMFPTDASDEEMFAEVNVIAERIGTTASDAGSPNGHYNAIRSFGPVRCRAVVIPHAARDEDGEAA